MMLAIKIRLNPSPEVAEALSETLERCNQEANRVSRIARGENVYRRRELRAITYAQVRQAGLGSQAAQHVIRKVADAYTTHRANLRAGHYGKRNTKRRIKAEAKIIQFRPHAAQPFDDRNLSWDHTRRCVSIWTTRGRIKDIPFTGNEAHLDLLAQYRKGETDLFCDRKGRWFLVPLIEVEEPEAVAPNGFIGVDMGLANIATTEGVDANGDTTDDRNNWSGAAITERRLKNSRLRRRLQKKGTKSAKRLLKKRAGKEARFAKDTNHTIAKRIVAEAERTGRGIAVEKLTGIRARVRHRKPQRAIFHSWAFSQLGTYIAYKAALAGVPLIEVEPAYTSQGCSQCGHVAKTNRKTRDHFVCDSCGISLDADANAAINIARLGLYEWQGCSQPPTRGLYAEAIGGRELQARSFRSG